MFQEINIFIYFISVVIEAYGLTFTFLHSSCWVVTGFGVYGG